MTAPVLQPPAAVELPAEALEVDALEVRFGGVRAVDGVHLTVGPEEAVGLIGTNGAGKTTLMDCVSGYVLPSAGRIRLFGTEVSRTPPELRPYLGLGRSFQDARLFPGMTVTETLLVAVERHLPTGLLAGLLGLGSRQERAKRDAVGELVEMTGLTRYADTRTGELSTGTRRVVDLTCILAQRPRLLLLDEPTAGVAQRETEAFGPLLRRIKAQLGCAVLIIEHDMPLITSLSDRIYAMESGRVIAEGTPDVVKRDPRVVASYLGTTEEAINRSNQPGTEPSAPPLADLTRAQLLVLAAAQGLPGRGRMTKDQLVRALS